MKLKICTISTAILALLVVQFSGAFAESQGTSQGSSSPTWQIMKNGKDHPVKWVDYAANPRFAVYDAGTPDDPADDAVLDKETGLVWERHPSDIDRNYRLATSYALQKEIGGRLGWRIPTAEEFLSIVDMSTDDLLTPGHPFLNVQSYFYWTSTSLGPESTLNWTIDFRDPAAADILVFSDSAAGGSDSGWHIWCVRGGQGVGF